MTAPRMFCRAIGLAALGCATAQTTTPAALPAPEAVIAADALPHIGACRRAARFEPMELGGQDGNECIGAPPSPRDHAQTLYMQGDFAGAADCFIAMYRLDPQEELFFNAAQAYRMAGRRDLARFYYARFVAAAPAGERVDEARRHIDELGSP